MSCMAPTALLAVMLAIPALMLALAGCNRRMRSHRAAALSTPAVLNACFRFANGTLTVLSSKIHMVKHCGDGKASTTDRVQVLITTDPPGALPHQVMLKTILLATWLRVAGKVGLRTPRR